MGVEVSKNLAHLTKESGLYPAGPIDQNNQGISSTIRFVFQKDYPGRFIEMYTGEAEPDSEHDRNTCNNILQLGICNSKFSLSKN